MHYIDTIIVGIYLLACLFFGFFKSKKINNIKEYTLGQGGFSTLILVATIFATAVNATTTIGKASMVYSSGLIYGLPSITISVAWVISTIIFSKNIIRFKGCISINEIMSMLYGKVGLYTSSVCVIIDSISLITIQITAIGFLFKYFYHFPYELGIFLGFGILIFYSAFGGVRAVAHTDLLQFLVFFIAFPIALGILYKEVGGYHNIINQLPDSYFSIFSENGTIWLFLSYMFYYILPSISAPNIQRMLMARSYEQLSKTFSIVAILFPVFSLVIIILAVCIKVKDPAIEPNIVLYYFINTYLPYGVIGIMISGMLAVMMSTADSWLNCASSTVAHDLIKNMFPKVTEKQEVMYARFATVCVGLISVLLALKIQKILELVWASRNFIFPVIYVPFIAGILGFRTSVKSFISAIILGMLFCSLGWLLTNQFGIISLCLGKIGSAIGLFSMHFLQKYQKESHKVNLKNNFIEKMTFYQKISKSIKKILSHKERLEDIKATHTVFAFVVIFANIPLSIFFYYPSNDLVNYSISLSRITSIVLCCFLYFYEYWLPKSYYKALPILWNLCLGCCLVFLPTFIVLVSNWSPFWLIYLSLSLILLSLFTSGYMLICLISSGAFFAYVFYSVVDHYNDGLISGFSEDYAGHTAYLCIVIGLCLIISTYNKAKYTKNEKLALTTLSLSIAHEVNTPLSISLIDAQLIRMAIDEKKYNKAKLLLLDQERTIKQGLQGVDTILSSINVFSRPKDWQAYSMVEVINDAIKSFFMDLDERKRIKFLDANDLSKDFQFIGSRNLLKHVIHNLIRNAFKHAGINTQITIWINENKLYFKDNGKGMSAEALKHVFKEYYSDDSTGYGVGLSFCKEAMHKMGGNIECISKLNEGTVFILNFNEII